MLEGHTLGRFGEVIEELGRSLVFRVNKEKPAKHKGKKMNKMGVDASFFFFFSGLAVFKFGTKVVMLLMNTFCQNMTEGSSG